MKSVLISHDQAGQRLDNALVLIFPELSLRVRRRLWDSWHIYVDEKAQVAGYRVKAGQMLSLKPKVIPEAKIQNEKSCQAHILQENDDFIFLYKPSGLHSTHLEHGGSSLEALLPSILPSNYTGARLCNRLDAATSGIVVIAKHETAISTWQRLENSGKCQKKYIALVQEATKGTVQTCTVTAALDTDKRKKSRILAKHADALRHTHFKPLAQIDEANYAALCQYFQDFPNIMPCPLHFMHCSIYKGARHQIRAHAAHAGFALFNDHRYVNENFISHDECFLLHHAALIMPQMTIHCPAPWADVLSQDLLEIIHKASI